jgi:hypothetical protein
MADTLSTGFNPVITPQQVYSADNIASASTPVAIDYTDPYKLRDYFLNTPDLVASRNAVAEANKNLIAVKQTGRAQQQAIQENPMAMNVIRGTQAVAGQQSSLREQAAAESLLGAQSVYDTFANEANARYNIAQGERAKLQDLILQTGGKAGISYTDDFNTALAKATSYTEKKTKEAEEKAKKEAESQYKKKLQATAMELGIGTKTKKGGTMSVKDLEKAISASKKADKGMQDELNRLKLQAERKSLAGSGKTDSGSLTTLLKTAAQYSSGGREWATSVASLYGVSPEAVKQATSMNGWEEAYRTPEKKTSQYVTAPDGTVVEIVD